MYAYGIHQRVNMKAGNRFGHEDSEFDSSKDSRGNKFRPIQPTNDTEC